MLGTVQQDLELFGTPDGAKGAVGGPEKGENFSSTINRALSEVKSLLWLFCSPALVRA